MEVLLLDKQMLRQSVPSGDLGRTSPSRGKGRFERGERQAGDERSAAQAAEQRKQASTARAPLGDLPKGSVSEARGREKTQGETAGHTAQQRRDRFALVERG